MIPDEIHKLQKLIILNVENNNISVINKNIFEIKTLKKAIFKDNNINYLPKEFTTIDCVIISFDINMLNLVSNTDDLGFFDLPEKYLRNVSHMHLDYINSSNLLGIYEFIETGYIKWDLNKVLYIKSEDVKSKKKDFRYLTGIWKSIKMIYGIPDNNAIIMESTFDERKEVIKDHIENGFNILKQRVINGDKDIIKSFFILIKNSRKGSFDVQLEVWCTAFMCLNHNIQEVLSIERFIKNILANIKENISKKITTLNSNPENTYIFLYWKYALQNELGFSNSQNNNFSNIQIYKSKGYILYKFFKEFRPKNVIEEILEIINKNQAMLSAIKTKIFKENEFNLSKIESFFEYEDKIKDQQIYKITFNGLLYILKSLDLIIN